MSSLSFDAASTASPLRTVVLFHSGFSRVEETTYLGMLLNLSANSPSRAGQAPAKLSYVTRPISSASVSSVSWSLNWFPSSPRSKANDHPGYLNSSPPGACITPSSDTNSVTTNLPILHSFFVAVAYQDPLAARNSSPRCVRQNVVRHWSAPATPKHSLERGCRAAIRERRPD